MIMSEADTPRAVGFNVYLSTDPDLPKERWKKVNDELVPDTKYSIDSTALESGVTYYAFVTAVSAAGAESGPSNIASFTVPPKESEQDKL